MPNPENARIYLVCHLPIELPETDLLTPIDAGRKDGDNIAGRNDWSELRAQYWVLHNTELPDYVGFFHFRRYLYPKQKGKKPYFGAKEPNPALYEKETWKPLLDGADLLVPRPEYTGLTVWERYAAYPQQNVLDLKAAVRILYEQHPGYTDAMERYLGGKSEYYGNIYVMRRDLFRAYCDWLFPILTAFRKERPDAGARTEGYLAERLFGIWLTEQQTNAGLRIRFLPRVHYSCYDDDAHRLTRGKRLTNFLLPPGSRIRGFVARRKLGKIAGEALGKAGINRNGEQEGAADGH